ncbi:hypothetical protein AOLI_G00011310 [Acnodon oligacanthus]
MNERMLACQRERQREQESVSAARCLLRFIQKKKGGVSNAASSVHEKIATSAVEERGQQRRRRGRSGSMQAWTVSVCFCVIVSVCSAIRKALHASRT